MAAIDFELACGRCGGSLRDCALDGVCPQCGAPVDRTLNTAVIDSKTMTVRDDLGCRQCDYNLRTLAIGSVCPECGGEVLHSLWSDPLASAGRSWLRAAWRGTAILALVAAVNLFLQIAWCLDFSLSRPFGSLWRYSYLIHLVVLLLWCVGVFQLTRRERYRPIWAPDDRIGSWARGAVVAMAVAGLLGHLVRVYWKWVETGQLGLWSPSVNYQTSTGMVYMLTAMTTLNIIFSAGALILVLMYLRRLTRQAGRGKRLETVAISVALADGLARVIVFGPGSFIVFQGYAHSSGSPQSSMLRDVAMAVYYNGIWVLTLVGLLVWLLAYLVFWRCRRMFG